MPAVSSARRIANRFVALVSGTGRITLARSSGSSRSKPLSQPLNGQTYGARKVAVAASAAAEIRPPPPVSRSHGSKPGPWRCLRVGWRLVITQDARQSAPCPEQLGIREYRFNLAPTRAVSDGPLGAVNWLSWTRAVHAVTDLPLPKSPEAAILAQDPPRSGECR